VLGLDGGGMLPPARLVLGLDGGGMLPPARLVLGLDGGGSKTLALLADEHGQILGRGCGGPSNFHVLGAERCFAVLEQTIAAAFADAGLNAVPLAAAVLGMAGVDRPEDRGPCLAWAEQFFTNAAVRIVNDAQLVLEYPAVGYPSGSQIAVISGTGAIVYGRNLNSEQLERSSGWGYLLGDEGSGFWIGQAALRSVARAADGRSVEGLSLVQPVLQFWGLEQPQQLIAHVYAQAAPRSEIARLARLINDLALAGDVAARRIIEQAGAELGLAFHAVAQRLGFSAGQPLAVALAGGVLIHAQAVRQAFLQSVQQAGWLAEPVTLVNEPAEAAVRLAMALLENAH